MNQFKSTFETPHSILISSPFVSHRTSDQTCTRRSPRSWMKRSGKLPPRLPSARRRKRRPPQPPPTKRRPLSRKWPLPARQSEHSGRKGGHCQRARCPENPVPGGPRYRQEGNFRCHCSPAKPGLAGLATAAGQRSQAHCSKFLCQICLAPLLWRSSRARRRRYRCLQGRGRALKSQAQQSALAGLPLAKTHVNQ